MELVQGGDQNQWSGQWPVRIPWTDTRAVRGHQQVLEGLPPHGVLKTALQSQSLL